MGYIRYRGPEICQRLPRLGGP